MANGCPFRPTRSRTTTGTCEVSDLSVVVLNNHTASETYFRNDEYEGGPRLVAIWIRVLPADAGERGL